jgi:hypothetical protein
MRNPCPFSDHKYSVPLMAFYKKAFEIDQGAVISRPLIIKKSFPSPVLGKGIKVWGSLAVLLG